MKKETDYQALARTAYEAATNEKLPPALRSYYAALALWADKKSR